MCVDKNTFFLPLCENLDDIELIRDWAYAWTFCAAYASHRQRMYYTNLQSPKMAQASRGPNGAYVLAYDYKDEVFASLEFTLWKFVFCIVTSSRSRKTHVSPMYCILALMWFILFERWRKTWTKGLCVRVWAIVEKEISNQTVDFLFCHCQFNEGSFGRNRK